MSNKVNRDQQRRLFLSSFIGFTIIFLLLGVIVFVLFRRAMLTSTDQALRVERSARLAGPPKQNANKLQPFSQRNQQAMQAQKRTIHPFITTTLIFDDAGKIMNESQLGSRYDTLRGITLNRSQVDQLHTIVVGGKYNFRTLLVKIPKSNADKSVAGRYLLIMENIDPQKAAMSNFTRVMLITVGVFWLLSIIMSMWMSRLTMRPILRSWGRQTEFVGNAAHELRTPLTIIQNKLEILLTKPNDKIIDQAENIAIANSESQRLQKLTQDLLALARSDSNTLQTNFEVTHVASFLTHTVEPYTEIAASQGKKLVLAPVTDFKTTLDQSLIHQLMNILIDNALKYSPRDSTITISAKLVGRKWQLIVADQGIGIKTGDRKRIFDRFYRVDTSRSRQTGGNGLGLSIAHWIVNLHHGAITVKENQPRGSQFVTTLPLNPSAGITTRHGKTQKREE
ncbi:Signal transduction histidine kinase [Levilactobacillus koreensis JCM 16448]|uniref:histidine kinase n=1 Tax=Levilactobacillus koreensis TaxID=637971 RepID=A0AAC8UUU6_9LACO|nr:ATP-binding protein [Levilactobacillus koreensis]AKP64926.1 histidine kinase [Levilactobacillus koreensis]KRK91297.1 Signal transduction histidine kinase [Levilactobacillus koreensis JCM 16448]